MTDSVGICAMILIEAEGRNTRNPVRWSSVRSLYL